MELALRAMLQTAPALSGVSIDWGARPAGSDYPGVVLTTVAASSGHTYGGPDGTTFSRVQVDVYALRYGQAKTLAREIRMALDGWRDGDVMGTFRESERDSRNDGRDGKPTVFRISQDFRIHWRL